METKRCASPSPRLSVRTRAGVVPIASLGLLALLVPVGHARAQATTVPAGLGCEGQQAQWVYSLSLSADGQVLAFQSPVADLVPGDTNKAPDIFVQDRASGRTTRVSVSSSGAQTHGLASWPSLSADGRAVAFMSDAADLVDADTNARMDVFVHDRRTARTVRVSVSSSGEQGNHHSMYPSVSVEGRRVVFESRADNLVAGDTNGCQDIFVHDLRTATTRRVSRGPGGVEADGHSYTACISADGTKVAFGSHATNLVPGIANNAVDIFVYDLQTGSTVRASLGLGGSEPDESCADPALSGDGRLVAFASRASNLVAGDTNDLTDIFVHDLVRGTTRRVSVSTTGLEGDGDSTGPSISAGGSTVAFRSRSANLVAGDTNGWEDIFVHDLASGQTTRESVSTGGAEGDGYSERSSLSADGRLLAFTSQATNLVPVRMKPYVARAYLRDRAGCSPSVAGYCHGSRTSVPGCVAALSGDGAPSLSAPGAFTLRAGPLPGGVHGLVAWCLDGPATKPVGSQGGLLCLSAPSWRTHLVPAGGVPTTCSGTLELTFADLLAGGPAVPASATVWAQAWFRDPQSADGYGLSSALWFQVCP